MGTGVETSKVEAPALPIGRWPASQRTMGLGIMAPIAELSPFGNTTPRFSDILQITQTAEAIGLDAVWVPDHLVMQFEHENNVIRGVWEGWTTLAGLAAATSKITLGVLVTCTSFRHPGVIAKMAENLDEISTGRFVLGLGAGWHKPEYDQFGFPFDHRVSRFEEAISIIAPMLREGRATFQGSFYQVNDVVNQPRGPRGSAGGPPILIGTGSPRMLRLTARFADAWNGDWHRETTTMVPLLERLDEACAEVGRELNSIVRTASSAIAMPGYLGRRANPIEGDSEQIAEVLAGFRALGLRHHVAGLDPCTPKSVEQYGRVVELLDKAN
jgi:alkanesulfonate monooxygenase SsuD/methylene tetrahydromethanopterin reductase-like flavin-dependent oxidoreductase (luciferase family)